MQVNSGSMTAIRFNHFLDNLAVTLKDTDAFIIMDNAQVHRGAEMDDPRHIIKKLSAYSPMLNPTENAFSAFKSPVKARLNVQAVWDQVFNTQAAVDQGLTLLQYRLGILDGVIRPFIEDMDTISAQKTSNWTNRMFAYLLCCLNEENIIMSLILNMTGLLRIWPCLLTFDIAKVQVFEFAWLC